MGDKIPEVRLDPFVHWPDTMMIELKGEGLLFTSDMFGSHGASRSIYHDKSPDQFELRDYYASILMVYSNMVERALKKVEELNPRLIAPMSPSQGGSCYSGALQEMGFLETLI
ncbi:MAG: hypothetical protein DRO05_04270 [Thermoproteota archaeon]|nr:MAG: hypothetical protein DRO05_04270 [Candidatus Korarchaeota archaeon]